MLMLFKFLDEIKIKNIERDYDSKYDVFTRDFMEIIEEDIKNDSDVDKLLFDMGAEVEKDRMPVVPTQKPVKNL